MPRDFRSDNTHGISPEILAAIERAGSGAMTSYGEDAITARVRDRCSEIFETEVDVFPVTSGTAGNALAIASMTPPWGGVFCHEDAHIHRDELGAPEFFTGGAKLFPIAGVDGKLTPAAVAHAVETIGDEGRTALPSCLSLTQVTEAGTVYTVDEVLALGEVARSRAMGVHMDGARFANAVVSLGCTPASLTWKAGVDVLVLGATKNGAMAAELMVVFQRSLQKELAPRWHRSGHRLSKMRFVSAQLEAYLSDELWLRNAQRANDAAARIARGISAEFLKPVDANAVFLRLQPKVAAALRDEGFLFYDWPLFGAGAVRIVTGFDTSDAEVDAFVEAVARASR